MQLIAHVHNGVLYVKTEDDKLHLLLGINVKGLRLEKTPGKKGPDIVGSFRIPATE